MNIKEEVEKNLQTLYKMDVKEQTLYRKWCQLNNDELKKSIKSDLNRIKNKIWIGNTEEKIITLKPKIISVNDSFSREVWDKLRHFTSTAQWYPSPNKLLKFIIIDENTEEYLGIISLSSPFTNLKPLNILLKWDSDCNRRNRDKMMVASTIVPTQPFGFNYVGGKLMTLLCGSNVVKKEFKNKYGYDLISIYTTSLYGSYSQYTRLKYWKELGKTTGDFALEPDIPTYKKIYEWMKINAPKQIELYNKNRRKNNLVSYFCKHNNITTFKIESERGVFYCPLYKNSNEILTEIDKEIGEKSFDDSVDNLTKIWKEKYAIKRIKNLTKDNRTINNILFYDDILSLDWDSTYKKYILGEKVTLKINNTLDAFFN